MQPYGAASESLDNQNYVIATGGNCPTVSGLPTTPAAPDLPVQQSQPGHRLPGGLFLMPGLAVGRKLIGRLTAVLQREP